MRKKIFVGNCDWGVDEAMLQQFIESFEINVVSVKVVCDRDTGRSRGFAFVELSDDSDLTHVINTLNEKELNGRSINVKEAEERSRSNSFNNNNDGGGYNNRFNNDKKNKKRW